MFISPRDKGSVVKETQNFVISSPPSFPAEPVEIPSDYWRIFMAPTTSTIDFLIGDLEAGAHTKPIHLVDLPSFRGLTSKDPNTFMF